VELPRGSGPNQVQESLGVQVVGVHFLFFDGGEARISSGGAVGARARPLMAARRASPDAEAGGCLLIAALWRPRDVRRAAKLAGPRAPTYLRVSRACFRVAQQRGDRRLVGLFSALFGMGLDVGVVRPTGWPVAGF